MEVSFLFLNLHFFFKFFLISFQFLQELFALLSQPCILYLDHFLFFFELLHKLLFHLFNICNAFILLLLILIFYRELLNHFLQILIFFLIFVKLLIIFCNFLLVALNLPPKFLVYDSNSFFFFNSSKILFIFSTLLVLFLICNYSLRFLEFLK